MLRRSPISRNLLELRLASVALFATLSGWVSPTAAQQAPQAPFPAGAAIDAPQMPSEQQRAFYRDLDLLRRGGFAEAERASVSLRIFDRNGVTPAGLQGADFQLIVNGTSRRGHLHAPGIAATSLPPMVLLVLPPNQPIVHSIAVKNAERYFAKQPDERLPWKVAIFDSNAKLTPFTNGRSQLLAYLDVVEHAREPIQYASEQGLPRRYRWDGGWLDKAEDAIGMMQRYDGPKVVLAINPLAESMYGLNEGMFAHDGPEALVAASKQIGAHVYVANVGGPDVYVPSGQASEDQPAQRVSSGGQLQLGTSPSYHMQVDPQMIASLNYFAYRTSMMMQTAADTMGGFANSLSELAGKIHTDLDDNYSLEFELTPEDTDRGMPNVEVRMVRHDLKVAILDVFPVGSAAAVAGDRMARGLMDTLRKGGAAPVASPEFRIVQHTDYFPLHAGLEPVVPMSGVVEWTGKGRAPRQVSVIEALEEPALSHVILERSIEADWDGRSLSWERDGRLKPGQYLWRVAVHDGKGSLLASAEKKIDVDFPAHEPVGMSSLVVGKACREEPAPSGLQQRPAKPGSQDALHASLLVDPMHAADCRVKPDATGAFAASDTLHAFVRIYPVEKLEKHRPEAWTAHFVLRGEGDAVETESRAGFRSDSGSGYLGMMDLSLKEDSIHAGVHALTVTIEGPGIHGELSRSRSILINAPFEAASQPR